MKAHVSLFVLYEIFPRGKQVERQVQQCPHVVSLKTTLSSVPACNLFQAKKKKTVQNSENENMYGALMGGDMAFWCERTVTPVTQEETE